MSIWPDVSVVISRSKKQLGTTLVEKTLQQTKYKKFIHTSNTKIQADHREVIV